MEQVEPKDIKVISISSVPMMSSGGVLGAGMISIYAFHRELVNAGFNVSYLQCSHYPENFYYPCEKVSTLMIKTYNNVGLIGKSKILKKIIGLPIWLVSAFWHVLKYVNASKKNSDYIVLVGHLADGALLASIVGKVTGLPNISRLYGSLLPFRTNMERNYPVKRLVRIFNTLRWWEEKIGLAAPADGYALTNDGTLLERYIKIKHGERILYYHEINGVEVDLSKLESIKADSRTIKKRIFNNEQPLIVTACRLIPWKRVDRVIEIAKLTKKLNLDYNFIILGDGVLKKDLVRNIHKNGLNSNVKIISGLGQQEVLRYLQACDVYLSVQDYSNLTNTTMEALMLERPVVTLDVGGIRDIINPDVNGILVPLASAIPASTNAIKEIINDPYLSAFLSKNAGVWAKNRVKTWSSRSESDIKLIYRVLENRCCSCVQK